MRTTDRTDGTSPASAGPAEPARQGRRRARSALLFGLGCFVLTQLAIGLAIVLWMPAVRDPFYNQKAGRLKSRLGRSPSSLSVVMLGSSRTAYGFAPRPVEASLARELGRPVVAFNFGLFGAGPATELLTLRRLLDEGIRPSLLLVEVLPPLLAGQVPLLEFEEERIPTWTLRATDLSLVESYGASVRPGLRREWYGSWLVPTYSHRLDLLNHTLPLLLAHADRRDAFAATDTSGWGAIRIPSPERRKQIQAEQDKMFHTFLDGFRLGGPAAAGLCDILETCRRENIPAALVLMPEGPTFRSGYPQEAWDQIEAYLAELSRCYGVPIVRSREWFPEEAFIDSHHMRPETAAAFTQRLAAEVIVPLLRKQTGPQLTPAAAAAAGRASGGGG